MYSCCFINTKVLIKVENVSAHLSKINVCKNTDHNESQQIWHGLQSWSLFINRVFMVYITGLFGFVSVLTWFFVSSLKASRTSSGASGSSAYESGFKWRGGSSVWGRGRAGGRNYGSSGQSGRRWFPDYWRGKVRRAPETRTLTFSFVFLVKNVLILNLSLTVEVLRSKGPNTIQDRDPIFERGSTTTYSSFRKGTYTKPWSIEGTSDPADVKVFCVVFFPD